MMLDLRGLRSPSARSAGLDPHYASWGYPPDARSSPPHGAQPRADVGRLLAYADAAVQLNWGRHMGKIRGLALCALVLSWGVCATVGAADLPNEAPEGKRWMGCWIRLQFPDYTSKKGVAGYWLVDAPDESDGRNEAISRYKEQWITEYTPVLTSEYPGFSKFESGCVSWKTRGEFPSYAAWSHDKLSQAFRSDFVPSFSKGFVSSKGDAWPE